jgi:hypothetical protein
MGIMPEMIMHTINKSPDKTAIIGRSPTGKPVVSFETESQAKRWIEKSPNHRITWFKQTITEEQVQIDI